MALFSQRSSCFGLVSAKMRSRAASGTGMPRTSSAVTTALASHDLSCARPDIDVDTSRFQPGGAVSVTVTCDLSLADLSHLGVPGTRRLTARSTSVIDTYRSEAP